MTTLQQKIDFTVIIDKMKQIDRRTKIIGVDRRETDAEHSFSIALMAYIFREYAKDIDLEKTIIMLLAHDLVEIYAGDTFAYDVKGNESKNAREEAAAKKLFTPLGDDGKYLNDLWHEFDKIKTNEAKFANALDRSQPIINNIYNEGGTWNEFHVKWSQLLKRMEPIKNFNIELYEYLITNSKPYFSHGHYLINDSDNMFFIGEEIDPDSKLEFEENDKEFIIKSVYTKPEKRGLGLAKILVQESDHYAKSHNKKTIPLCPYAKTVLK